MLSVTAIRRECIRVMASVSSTGNTILPTYVLLLLFAITPPYVTCTACGGTLTDLNGTIQSPGYPGNYFNDIHCVWVISAPVGYRITVTFHVFDLQSAQNENCPNSDHVQIQDGGAEDSLSLGFLCGSHVPTPRRTFGNVMRFSFTADGVFTAAVFLVSYVSENLPNNFMLLTDSYHNRIMRLDLGTVSNYRLPVEGVFSPLAVDYDPLEDRIYWTESGFHGTEIRSAFPNGKASQIVQTFSNSSKLYGLAVDNWSCKIFYTDAGRDVISFIFMDSDSHETIITTALDEPRAIALDTVNSVVYWTDVGVAPRLERVNYDGNDRRAIVSTGLSSPNGIAIDVKYGLLYWVDADTANVERCDLDGKNRTLLAHAYGRSFYGVALHGDELYVTEWEQLPPPHGDHFYMTDWGQVHWDNTTSNLLRMDTRGGDAVLYAIAPGRLTGIHIYTEDSRLTGCEFPAQVVVVNSPVIAVTVSASFSSLVIIVACVLVQKRRTAARAAARNLVSTIPRRPRHPPPRQAAASHNNSPPGCWSPPPPYAVNPPDLNEHAYEEQRGDNSHRCTTNRGSMRNLEPGAWLAEDSPSSPPGYEEPLPPYTAIPPDLTDRACGELSEDSSRRCTPDRAPARSLEPVEWHVEDCPCAALGYGPPPPYTVIPPDLINGRACDELSGDNSHRCISEPQENYLSQITPPSRSGPVQSRPQ